MKMNIKSFKKVTEDDKTATLRNVHGHEIKIAKTSLSPAMLQQLNEIPLCMAEGGYVNSTNQVGALKENYGKKRKKFANGGEADDETIPSTEDKPESDIGKQAEASDTQQPAQTPIPAQDLQEPATTPEPSWAGQPTTAYDQAPVMLQAAEPAAEPKRKDVEPLLQHVPGQPGMPLNPQESKQDFAIEDKHFSDDLQNGHITPKTYKDLMFKETDGTDKSTWGKVSAIFGLLIGSAGAGLSHQPNQLLGMYDKIISNDLEAQKQSKINSQNIYRMNLATQMQNADIKYKQAATLLLSAQTAGQEATTSGTQAQTAKTQFETEQLLPSQVELTKQQAAGQAATTGKTIKETALILPAQAEQLRASSNALRAEALARADTLTHMQMNRAALHDLFMKNEEIQKSLTYSPAYKQQANQAYALIAQSVDTQNSNLSDAAAGKKALAEAILGANNGQETDEQSFQKQQNFLNLSGNKGLADYKSSLHVPGVVGQASVPITEDDREKIKSGVTFQQQLDRFQKFVDTHKTAHLSTWSPKDRLEGEALAAGLQGAYRQATNGGVYKAGEQTFIGKIIDDTPSRFLNELVVNPKLKAIRTDSRAQFDTLLKSKGFKGIDAVQGVAPTAPTGEKMPKVGDKGSDKNGNPVIYDGKGWKRVSK